MKARLWLNLALALLLAGLVALALWRPGQTPEEDARLTALDATAVARIVIERPQTEQRITLARTAPEAWRVVEHEVEANGFLVERILGLARTVSHAQFLPETLAPYGLQQPDLIVHLDDIAITFGDTEPLAERRYVQVGDTVHLIDDMVSPLIGRRAENFVSQRLLPREVDLNALHLPGLTLQRATGGWVSEPPAASHDQVQALLDEWRYAGAYSVQAHDETEDAGEEVLIELGDGHRLTYRVLQREPELVLLREGRGLAYHFPSDTAQRLFALPAAPPEVDAADPMDAGDAGTASDPSTPAPSTPALSTPVPSTD